MACSPRMRISLTRVYSRLSGSGGLIVTVVLIRSAESSWPIAAVRRPIQSSDRFWLGQQQVRMSDYGAQSRPTASVSRGDFHLNPAVHAFLGFRRPASAIRQRLGIAFHEPRRVVQRTQPSGISNLEQSHPGVPFATQEHVRRPLLRPMPARGYRLRDSRRNYRPERNSHY